MTFEILCKELSPQRRQVLAPHEVAVVGRPIRLVLAVGGAYIFYYGTNGEAPAGFQSAAAAFSIVGIAAVLVAIFIQKLVEIRYFSKALKEGCFPAGVSVGEGGVYIRRAGNAGGSGAGNAGGSGSGKTGSSGAGKTGSSGTDKTGSSGTGKTRSSGAGKTRSSSAGYASASVTDGVVSVNAERFYAFAEIGNIIEYGEEGRGYFKMSLPGGGGAPGVFLFKEDFDKGDPEAFIAFIDSKRPE